MREFVALVAFNFWSRVFEWSDRRQLLGESFVDSVRERWQA